MQVYFLQNASNTLAWKMEKKKESLARNSTSLTILDFIDDGKEVEQKFTRSLDPFPARVRSVSLPKRERKLKKSQKKYKAGLVKRWILPRWFSMRNFISMAIGQTVTWSLMLILFFVALTMILEAYGNVPLYKSTETVKITRNSILNASYRFVTKSYVSMKWLMKGFVSWTSWFNSYVPRDIWITMVLVGYISFKLKYKQEERTKTMELMYSGWYMIYTARTFIKCDMLIFSIIPLIEALLGETVHIRIALVDFIYAFLYVLLWVVLYHLDTYVLFGNQLVSDPENLFLPVERRSQTVDSQ